MPWLELTFQKNPDGTWQVYVCLADGRWVTKRYAASKSLAGVVTEITNPVYGDDPARWPASSPLHPDVEAD